VSCESTRALVAHDVMCYCRHSSDESTHADADVQLTANMTRSSPRGSVQPSAQSSRPSSRQGQKYTTRPVAVAAAADAAPSVAIGSCDAILPNRKVNLTLQYLNI